MSIDTLQIWTNIGSFSYKVGKDDVKNISGVGDPMFFIEFTDGHIKLYNATLCFAFEIWSKEQSK